MIEETSFPVDVENIPALETVSSLEAAILPMTLIAPHRGVAVVAAAVKMPVVLASCFADSREAQELLVTGMGVLQTLALEWHLDLAGLRENDML